MAKSGQKRVSTAGNAALRRLPAVARLLESRPLVVLRRRYGARLTADLVRERIDRLRAELLDGRLDAPALARASRPAAVAAAVAAEAEALLRPRPRRVINATGVVVHTNLGRSVLGPEAARAVAEAASGYLDLEYDVAGGRRGSRLDHLAPLMQRLFPGHGFCVVNNNAAAVMLCLRALARRKQVVISRGELVEIGGSFRVPDILAASGARLCEVGTTNRTRLADYEAALGEKTGALLKVHTSNFRVVGFAEETTVAQLAALARARELPLIVDWGSGDLADLEPFGIHDEVPVRRLLDDGADLVTFSGDKLLGGPQAGFVVGRRELIERVRRDPLARVCRLDRLLVAALHRVLAAYVAGRELTEIPTLAMIAAEPAAIERRARRLMRAVRGEVGREASFEIVDGVSRTGGGSSPTGERPTRLLAVGLPEARDAGRVEESLRAGEPPVVGRVRDGRLLLDLRTVLDDQDELLAELLVAAIREAGS